MIQLPKVQTWIVGKAAHSLSKKLGTEVSIGHVNLSFFHSLQFEKLLIRDKKGDTLLYAGKASADATNWFYLKDHFTIKDVRMENGVLKMNRNSNIWNYQFLLDHFAIDNLKKTNSSLSFDINQIRLKNFRISSVDDWIGESMKIGFDELGLKIKNTDFKKGSIEIERIDSKNPYFTLWNYDGTRTAAEGKIAHQNTKEKESSESLKIKIGSFHITNGSFFSDQPTDRDIYANKFDELHIRFTNINAILSGIYITPNALKAHLTMDAKERCGFKLNKLESDVSVDSSMMEFSNLTLLTDKSKVGDYYAMKYRDFKNDMNDFLNRVDVVGRLTKSKVHSDDIAFFAPELKDWKRTFDLIGKTSGTLNRFEIRDMIAKSNNTLIQGGLSLRDIDDLDNMFLIFNSTGSLTNFKEISSFAPKVPALKKEELQQLGDLYYKGNFTGYLTDFVAKGIIRTNLGSINTDLKFDLKNNDIPTYEGEITTENFELGTLTAEKSLGNLSLKGKVKGQGFSLKTIKTNFNGQIAKIGFNGYDYKNIDIDGSFEKNNFNGNLNIADSNLTIKGLKGKILIEEEKVTVNLSADIQKANLNSIKLINKEIGFSGKIDMNFSGSDIDHIQGEAIIHSGSLQHKNKILPFSSLTLNASKFNDEKSISLRSDVLEASITGQYTMKELPDAFKLFLHNYYPTYIPKPNLNLSDQQFSFSLKTENIDEIMQVILPEWEGGNNASIQGALNLSKNEFRIDADVPYFSYKNNRFKNTSIRGIGNLDTLYVAAKLEDYYSSDSLHLTNSSLELKSKDDISEIQMHSGQEGTLNEGNVNAQVQTFSDGFNLQFLPSNLVLNGKKWDIQKDGNFSIRGDLVQAHDISLTHKNESISLTSELDDLTDNSSLKATLKNVQSGDFIPLFFRDPEVNGSISGTVSINDPLGRQNIDFNAQIDSLRIEKELIGKVSVNGIAQTKEGQMSFNANSIDTTNDFHLKGGYNFADSSNKYFLATLKSKKIKLSILKPYLTDVFDEMEGTATTDLTLTYGKNKEYLTGQVMVNKASIKVGYTQVRYFIENQPIVFKEDEISFNLLLLKDSLGNSAAMGGRILHRFFDDFEFRNLRIESSKLSLLNTTKKDNDRFYGQAIGRAKMNIVGPINNLRIQIDAEPMTLDSSHIYLSTSEGKESNTVNYIDFSTPEKKDSTIKKSENSNVVVVINVKANPACKVDVILDEETGDVIKGQGNGNISVVIGNIEPLKIRGNYELLIGEYTFNFQTYLKRPFTLNRGGTITWNGDPYQALINIDAEYLAKNVDIGSLSSTGLQQKADVKIISHLSGNLQNPTVKFEFVLPEQRTEAKRDDILVKRLADFKNDDNEMNKQVASLLLFNTFIVGNQNFLTQGNASSLITNTIGGVVSNLLTTFFNRELEKATKGILSTYIDINPTLDLQKSASLLQANIRAGLKILLDKRLVMLVGGNLDYNNPTFSQQLERRGLLTPDITIEWLINRDGSLRVVGFNRSSIDFTLNQRNRSGLQLSYRKDFNRITDILKSRKKLAQEDKTIYTPAIKPEDQ